MININRRPFLIALFAKGAITGDPIEYQGFDTESDAREFLANPPAEIGAIQIVRFNGVDLP